MTKPHIKYHSEGWGHMVLWRGCSLRMSGTLDTIRVYWRGILAKLELDSHC